MQPQLIPCKLTILETRHEQCPIRTGEVAGWLRDRPKKGSHIELMAPALEAAAVWRLVWTSRVIETLQVTTDIVEAKTENSLYRLEFGEHGLSLPSEELPEWFSATGRLVTHACVSVDESRAKAEAGGADGNSKECLFGRAGVQLGATMSRVKGSDEWLKDLIFQGHMQARERGEGLTANAAAAELSEFFATYDFSWFVRVVAEGGKIIVESSEPQGLYVETYWSHPIICRQALIA